LFYFISDGVIFEELVNQLTVSTSVATVFITWIRLFEKELSAI